MPEAFSRASQHRARKDLCYTDTPYGALVYEKTLKLSDHEELDVGFQNPLAYTQYHAEHSENYGRIMREALAAHPPSPDSPWTVILYQDGVDPGDAPAKNKSRHSVTFYWSFLEFGTRALAHEEVWGCSTIVRTKKATKT